MDISRLPDELVRMVSEFATNKNMIKFATPAEQRKALWEHRIEEFAKKWAARRVEIRQLLPDMLKIMFGPVDKRCSIMYSWDYKYHVLSLNHRANVTNSTGYAYRLICKTNTWQVKWQSDIWD
jgi:hypothetical protein